MKRFGLFLIGAVVAFFLVAQSQFAWSQNPGSSPDTAFDPVNNRYLMVWEQDDGSGFKIKGKFLNPDGSDAGTEVFDLSPDRPTQGCFYGNFDSDNGNVSTPTNCPNNRNPAVAYNDGQFLIAWEVQGMANAPAAAPANQFTNIFARVVDAGTLNPVSGFEEGILISKVFIAANNANDCGNGKFACNDSEIQAWSQSKNPHVAPRLGAGGFVVTWETNKDFIGCASSDRRAGLSVYGRYIDQSFSATSTTNPPMFAIFKDDSTMDEKCAPIENVDNGKNARIAFNQSTNDFVVAYEIGRANGGRTSIGAKRVTLNASNVGEVGGSMMGGIVASVDGTSLKNPEIISFQGNYVLFADDGADIRVKQFASSNISDSEPAILDLGTGDQENPRAATNLGAGGQGPTTGGASQIMLVSYKQGSDIYATLVNDTLSAVGANINLSDGMSTGNDFPEVSSNSEDFVSVWQGDSSGPKVFAEFVDSEAIVPTPTPVGIPPTAPGLLAPDDGVTFSPIRAFLSWNASTDPDGDDTAIRYNLYFGETSLPGTPQATSINGTTFVVGPETESMTGITLAPNKIYKWAIEAKDADGDTTLSAERTLVTDNSVVGWWRFDENPAGADCAGGDAGETVCDYSGNNNHGVPFGNPTWIMPGMVDILGGAIDFDGVDDRILIPYSTDFDVGANLTVSCRIHGTTVPTPNASILLRDTTSGTPGPFGINQTNTNVLGFAIRKSTVWYSVSFDMTSLVGSYFRVTGVYDGANIEIFNDANLEDTVATAGTVENSNNDLEIGRHIVDDTYFNDQIDECFILDKVPGAGELANWVNAEM